MVQGYGFKSLGFGFPNFGLGLGFKNSSVWVGG